MESRSGMERAGTGAADPPLVDAHAHVYKIGMPLSTSAWHHPADDATIEDYLATLDAAGIRFGVLAAASLFGDYNDYMLEAVRTHKRLRTTVIVPPDTDPYILRMMKEDGVVGIRLQFRTVETPPDLASHEYQKLLRRVADLDWHVHLHDESERLPHYVTQIEKAGPKLVIDHFGRPASSSSDGFRAVLDAVGRGRTWVKLSGAFRLEPKGLAPELAGILLRHAGPERLLWGSDWPFAAFEGRVAYEDVLAQYAENVPSAAVRRAIDQTALQFYFG